MLLKNHVHIYLKLTLKKHIQSIYKDMNKEKEMMNKGCGFKLEGEMKTLYK